MILVVGATGLVGNEVCRRLMRKGESVRALARITSSREKVEALRSSGVDVCIGDLKDPDSLGAACRGVDAVISTASSTLSRQDGDSVESVDGAGQLSLVSTARAAGVERFIFVSFRRSPRSPSPLGDAKDRVEKALLGMNFTIVQASFFMEVWLSPALGFDYANAAARIYGSGASRISWVSYSDVAEMCSLALRHPAAGRKTIEFGGPEALSPLEVVARFEAIGGRPFTLDRVSEETLRSQLKAATDSMQRSFAALMLGYVNGDAMNITPVVEQFGIKLTSVEEYARRVLGKAAHA